MATVTRSPNYPQISLPDAIERVRKIYKAEHTHRAGDEVLAKNLGYNSLNGTSRSILSALKKYGLLQADGDGFRVSDDAVDILELPRENPAHRGAVERAVLRPALFAELHEIYGEELPSDSNLRHFLIKKKFHPGSAAEVIRLYRETLTHVLQETAAAREATPAREVVSAREAAPAVEAELNGGGEMTLPFGALEGEAPSRNGHHAGGPSIAAASRPVPAGFTDVLQYRVALDCRAQVCFEGPVTQAAIRKLIAHLELSMDDFPQHATE